MTPEQYQMYFYCALAFAAITHLVLIAAEWTAYLATRIKSLIVMIIGNLIGLMYLAVGVVRAYQHISAAHLDFVIAGAALYTSEVVIGVWGFLAFLGTASATIRRRSQNAYSVALIC